MTIASDISWNKFNQGSESLLQFKVSENEKKKLKKTLEGRKTFYARGVVGLIL